LQIGFFCLNFASYKKCRIGSIKYKQLKINTKIRYGLRALIEVGMNDDQNGVLQKDIAKNQQIPLKYLDHIISSLKVKGLLVNAGGKSSGYRLGRNAHEVSVYDVYMAFEPELSLVDCISEQGNCVQKKSCSTGDFWCRLNTSIKEQMKKETLEDMISRQIQFIGNNNTIHYVI